jgi:hypothetical protein
MTKDEALKLALEALGWTDEWRPQGLKEEAITAIKEALAQPEQEPVAWRYRWSVEDGHWVWNYATYIERQKDDRCEPLYTTPPQRTWVGLTNEDKSEICDMTERDERDSVMRLVEAKLKARNI